MIQLSIIGENKTIYVTAFNNRHNSYEKFINCLTKMKRWRNFTHDNLLATEKIGGHINFIAYSEEKFISQFLLDYIGAINT